MKFKNTLDFAKELDQKDPLREYRDKFFIPAVKGKKQEKIYFCGNSLGLQPRSVRDYVKEELHDWANLGVEGHVEATRPWMHYHKFFQKSLGALIGAQEQEVVPMNTLTVNLHLMLVSFYRPTKKRFKVIMEAGEFPSDQYAMESQVRYHGFDPDEAIIELKPRFGEHTIQPEDVLDAIKEAGDSLALVMLGAVNYYTGQLFDMKRITAAAHKVGAVAGFDLAHAIGNVPMSLHDWKVDFATWCSYKYLNSGPGGVSGIFVHEKYAEDKELPRFAGWWGHTEGERFKMRKGFVPMPGAPGWQLSNAQILPMAVHRASLDIFDVAGIENLRRKSLQLTGYLEFLLKDVYNEGDIDFLVITPEDEEQRGAQLSILFTKEGRVIFEKLSAQNVVADWREPNVIRVAPAPLYNTYEEVWHFADILRNIKL